MKDPFTVMPRDTAAMFNLLQDIPCLNDFILIGGTALALRIGHRQSEDLDFITLLPTLPRATLTKVEDIIREQGHSIVPKDNPAASDDFEIAGMDIRDHSQDWLIDGSVKITFFAAEEHHKRILVEPGNDNGFRIGSLAELCQLKALVASSRSKSRDWLDLFVLERDYKFGLAQWKESYDKAGLIGGQFRTALGRICGGKTSPADEGFESLIQSPPSLEDIAIHFRALRNSYEIDLAKSKLRKDAQGSDASNTGREATRSSVDDSEPAGPQLKFPGEPLGEDPNPPGGNPLGVR